MPDDDACGAVEQTAANARQLAADGGHIGVVYAGAAILGRQRNTALGMAESERATGGSVERDRPRWIEVGQPDVGRTSATPNHVRAIACDPP